MSKGRRVRRKLGRETKTLYVVEARSDVAGWTAFFNENSLTKALANARDFRGSFKDVPLRIVEKVVLTVSTEVNYWGPGEEP